jgi:hypothetical protein
VVVAIKSGWYDRGDGDRSDINPKWSKRNGRNLNEKLVGLTLAELLLHS